MANVNKVILIGNLTRDPELRYTPKGTAVSDIGLAVNRVRKAENGETIEETTFVDVTLWGRQAELAEKYLEKGRSVYIDGRLQLDTWEDKETRQKRSKLRVVGENMQFIGYKADENKPREGNSKKENNASQTESEKSYTERMITDDDDDDDIPF